MTTRRDDRSPPMMPDDSSPKRIDAVVIGASAGGVEALLAILPSLPADTALAIFIVVHLQRARSSALADLFGRRCAMQVREAEDKEPVVPGTIYFAPPDYHLLLDRGPSLALTFDEPVNYSRPSIDVLFESAADVYGNKLAGFVLTGANSDGAAGLDAVRRAGGLTIVEDPATAASSAMPTAALRRVAADFVASIDGIATLLRTLAVPTEPAGLA